MTWASLAFWPVVAAYLLLMVLLLGYVLNYLYLAIVALRHRGDLLAPPPDASPRFPHVTVQLPIYNELYVAERAIRAAAALDYPRDLLEIQVLDDSTDETVERVAAEVRRQRLRGIDISHIRRSSRAGFKAGALAEGLATAKGDFVAVFDADFVPAPDFLTRMMPQFDTDRIAFVQARWGHLNPDYSLLTQLQALSLDAHFAIDQLARSSAGHMFNFNGTAGIWRKDAILDAGGWQAETLTEDLDLSYRAFLRGWSARYAGDVEAAAELPVSFTAFRQQQHRWARGSLECAVRYLPQIWRARMPLSRKLTATLHLTAYLTHFLTLGLILIFPLLLGLSVYFPRLLDPVGFGLLPNLMFVVPTLYFAIAQHLLGRPWWRKLPLIFITSILDSGLMLNTLSAALQILRRKIIPFERTPKYGILDGSQDWRLNPYRVRVDLVVLFEVLLGGFTLWTASFAWRTGHWLMLAYSLCFAVGLLFASAFTLIQSLSQRLASGPSAGIGPRADLQPTADLREG